MVWLPDLHPSTVVALNRRSLQEVFSNDKFRVRRGREALSALMQNRLAVEDKFRSFRPADFADVFRRYPPSGRSPLREKMNGIALILTPDSFIKKNTLIDFLHATPARGGIKKSNCTNLPPVSPEFPHL